MPLRTLGLTWRSALRKLYFCNAIELSLKNKTRIYAEIIVLYIAMFFFRGQFK